MSDDFETATRYLRGELPDAVRAGFEERILAEAELYALVAMAEDELLEDYARGDLRGDARARLAARLAVEPALRDRLAMTIGLGAIAARKSESAPAPMQSTDAAVVPLRARPAAARARARWWLAAPALAAAAIVAIVLWPGGDAGRRPPAVVSVALAIPTRANAVTEVVVPRGTGALRVALPIESQDGLAIAVRGPGGPAPIAIVAEDGGVVVVIAGAAIVPGLHELTVTAAGTPIAAFQLRVVDGAR